MARCSAVVTGGVLLLCGLVVPARAQVGLLSGQTNFGNTVVGSPVTSTLTYLFSGSVTLTGVSVVTQGAVGLDFVAASGGTCAASSYASGDVCTVNFSFTPAAQGLRLGAVQLLGSGGPLLTTFVSGVGAPLVARGPAGKTTIGSGLSAPTALAMDGAGNVYIADVGTNKVDIVLAAGGQTTVGTGLNSPEGVAVDSGGDVFIGDTGNNRVLEIPAGGGAQVTVGSGFSGPQGLAADAAGDLFVADAGNNRVVELPAGGGAQIVLGSGLSHPAAVAVDGAGNVFIADYFNGRLVEEPAGGGSQITVGSSITFPQGVAVDGAGNVFISDGENSRADEYLAGSATGFAVVSGVVLPWGVALDGAGDFYVADRVNSRVVALWSGAINLGGVPIGTTSASATLIYTFASAATLTGDSVLTGGTPGLDFADPTPGLGFCAPGSYVTGQQCKLNFSLNPSVPGSRTGAVELLTGGSPLLAAHLYGVGQGPQVAFGPGVLTPLNTGSYVPSSPTGVAVDQAGNFYFADPGNNQVLLVPAGGGSATPVGSGLSFPFAVALDGAENVLIADAGNNRVVEVPANGGSQFTLVSGLSFPRGVAADWAGDVLIADSGHNRIVEMPANGASQFTVGSGFSDPSGVALDPTNPSLIYVADTGNNSLDELFPGGNRLILDNDLSSPIGLALDAAGDIFVGNSGTNEVVEERPFAGLAESLERRLLAAAEGAAGLAYSPADNVLYIASEGSVTTSGSGGTMFTAGSVDFLSFAQQRLLDFGSVPVGTTSAPQTVTVTNSGNGPLDLKSVLLDLNATLQSSGGTDCFNGTGNGLISPGSMIASGGACALQLALTPTVTGPNSSSDVLSDNALNNLFATQTLTLTGTGTGASLLSQTILFPPLGPVTYGVAPFTLMATASSGLPVVFTTASEIGSVNGDTLTVSGAGTIVLFANQPGNSLYSAAPQVMVTLTVNPGTLIITASSPAMTYGGAVPAITPSYASFGNGDTSGSLTAQPICLVAMGNLTVGSVVATSCSGAIDSNYTITYVPGTVTVNPAPLMVTASSPAMTYGGTLPAITPSYASFGNGDTPANLTAPPICLVAMGNLTVGSVVATGCSGAIDPNYTITYIPGSVTVNPAPLMITASSPIITYGGTLPAITPIFTGFENGDAAGSLTAQPICLVAAGSITVGSLRATGCSGAIDPNYTITYVPGTVTVDPAPLTVVANNKTMTFGSALPALTFSISGFKNGDTAASLTAQPTCTTTANSDSAPGDYPIDCGGAEDLNYDIDYDPGVLEVDPSPQSINWGALMPNPITWFGKFSQTMTATATSGLPVVYSVGSGPGNIQLGDDLFVTAAGSIVITANQPGNEYYLPAAPVTQTLVIDKSPQSITFVGPASPVTYTSGVQNFNLVATASSGLPVTFSVTFTSGSGSVAGTTLSVRAVGSTVVAADQGGNIDYLPAATVTQNMTVIPVPLEIAVKGTAKTYGAVLPPITVIYTGLVGAETPATLTTPPMCNTTATSSSPAGSYPASCSGAVDPNYNITYPASTITVNPAPLTITANNASQVAGAANPAFTFGAAGFVNGDNTGSLTTQPTCSTTATPASPAGTYPIVCTGAVDPNYSIGYLPGTLTVTGAAGFVTLVESVGATVTLAGDGNHVATLTITNNGNVAATAEITAASVTAVVGGVAKKTAAVTALPVSAGTIMPGGSVTVQIEFPSAAGTSGGAAALQFTGTYTSSAGNGNITTTGKATWQ